MRSPSSRSLFRYYLNSFTFTIIGILGGLIMLLAILYVPILFAFTGFSYAFELLVSVHAGHSSRFLCCLCSHFFTGTGLAAAAPNGTG